VALLCAVLRLTRLHCCSAVLACKRGILSASRPPPNARHPLPLSHSQLAIYCGGGRSAEQLCEEVATRFNLQLMPTFQVRLLLAGCCCHGAPLLVLIPLMLDRG
jgi:hypothetical protein